MQRVLRSSSSATGIAECENEGTRFTKNQPRKIAMYCSCAAMHAPNACMPFSARAHCMQAAMARGRGPLSSFNILIFMLLFRKLALHLNHQVRITFSRTHKPSRLYQRNSIKFLASIILGHTFFKQDKSLLA